MRIAIVAALCASTLIAGSGALIADGKSSAAAKHGPIAWMESLDQAKKKAAKEKKVIMVDFYADWCGPCKEMLRTTYKDAKVVARSRKFVSVLLNVDKQAKIAQSYEVDSIPTVIFMDSGGKVIVRNTGLADSESFLKLMDEAGKKANH